MCACAQVPLSRACAVYVENSYNLYYVNLASKPLGFSGLGLAALGENHLIAHRLGRDQVSRARVCDANLLRSNDLAVFAVFLGA